MFNENIRLCLPEHPSEASTPATARRLLVLSASFSTLARGLFVAADVTCLSFLTSIRERGIVSRSEIKNP